MRERTDGRAVGYYGRAVARERHIGWYGRRKTRGLRYLAVPYVLRFAEAGKGEAVRFPMLPWVCSI
ncbi:unnamed protein product [Prunus armeniaca]|uniref:Uncharacterized protein n=1 Tax=Prunus armeniaca TaxID=36596 RepID=A0A6J5WSC2_PRUAR|nr:unnamed protein product [Prunus armeniaca]